MRKTFPSGVSERGQISGLPRSGYLIKAVKKQIIRGLSIDLPMVGQLKAKKDYPLTTCQNKASRISRL